MTLPTSEKLILSGLTYYPIKGCRGHEVSNSFLERMGLRDDRRMMVVTPEGRFLTQREHPRLALVTPELSAGTLRLCAPAFDSLRLPIRTGGTPWPVDIWKSKGVPSIDQGEEAAGWFSDWLGASVRLVHIAADARRLLNENYAISADDHTGFADGYPILLISSESLQDLNSRMETPLPMNRFRPNIVVEGCNPFDEDSWKRIRIGGVEMAVVKPCARCLVTTIDKQTLAKAKEPLKTLSTYRRHPKGVIFGQNVIPLGEGWLETGMPVEILS